MDVGKVGSAGIPGWDDAMCQKMAQQANDWAAEADQRGDNDDLEGSAVAAQQQTEAERKVYNNCLVVD